MKLVLTREEYVVFQENSGRDAHVGSLYQYSVSTTNN